MKKTYLTPKSTTFEMKAEQMIAASIGISEENVDINSSMSNEKDMWGNESMWDN